MTSLRGTSASRSADILQPFDDFEVINAGKAAVRKCLEGFSDGAVVFVRSFGRAKAVGKSKPPIRDTLELIDRVLWAADVHDGFVVASLHGSTSMLMISRNIKTKSILIKNVLVRYGDMGT